MKSEEEILKAIGNRLKAIRIEKGYTSYETFAIDHGLGRMQYWKLEKGETNPTMRTLLKVLAIHDMTLEEFFSEGFSK
ncbi:helix-turn-helix transcriptional regulator [Pontibacter burrus]|uniref:Helix-turn-helix transcriptional regulator n=1 Tax=Pontibacter burrus TaxID=2704466 RepID=A0A6B3LR79_9BACT|nr:helix-turn-helix transcriptional regulator [Pontibacter burrus]NEM99329.1 helix-turn-helix transcriptional regulator [Pontibacter burrus]